jgi:predicted nucleotidyltransferase
LNANITIDRKTIAVFCAKWKIKELAFFGSVLREDFGPDSDVDVLVTFEPDADWGLLDHVQMQDELSQAFDRTVDLVTRRSVEASENWIRREAILASAELVYAA